MTLNTVQISIRRAEVNLVRYHKPLQITDVFINYNEKLFGCKQNPTHKKISDILWKEKCNNNPRLFDKEKFRFAGSKGVDSKIEIDLGLTSYKELCVTNFQPNVTKLMQEGIQDFNDNHAYLSQALGVGILLLSSDDQLLLLRRSMWTGEAAGKWDRPGGHPEPCNVPELASSLEHSSPSQTDAGVNMEELSPEKLRVNDSILKEVWGSIIGEAVDEAGIPATELTPPQVSLLGLCLQADLGDRPSLEFYVRSSNVLADLGDRPSLEFYVRLGLTSAALQEAYSRGQQAEADESTSLLMLPLSDVRHVIAIVRRRYRVSASGLAGDCAAAAAAAADVMKDAEDLRLQELVKDFSPALTGALLMAEDVLLQE
ncbi:uridine diphosphate glucose pyrophosphatase NUDT22 [Hyalella azteca]|uniref:Uridine diphosphate glucose pyrophosphatase NUDT22 n=1 Tax=Hyalella azteca TaxID=294128 RepID=A0A8B7NIS3_HYAAZ|nr:uridine diphosphate glucose pyrophosphatase NUDT22 [Hyalella azteca]